MNEANLQKEIMLAVSKSGAIVWRQNTGALPDKNGRLVQFGLCKGSSDLIGICPDGRFLALEIKGLRGKPTDAQLRFIEAVKRKGGRAGVCWSVKDALDVLAQVV